MSIYSKSSFIKGQEHAKLTYDGKSQNRGYLREGQYGRRKGDINSKGIRQSFLGCGSILYFNLDDGYKIYF